MPNLCDIFIVQKNWSHKDLLLHSWSWLAWLLNNVYLQMMHGKFLIRTVSILVKIISSPSFTMLCHHIVECQVKKFEVSRIKNWILSQVASCSWIQVSFEPIFSNKNFKKLKVGLESYFISCMSIILSCIIMGILYIEEPPQDTVSIYFVYKILKACPI